MGSSIRGSRFTGIYSFPRIKMEFLAKSRIGTLLVAIAASSAVFAQDSGPGEHQSHASVLDARQIVGQSVAATERSWQARNHYVYMERDQDRRLDSLGQVKSENVDVTRMILVNGARFEQLMEHNGQLPSAVEQKKSNEDLEKLKHETLAEQIVRIEKDQENKSFLRDLLEAFDFHLMGEEIVDGRVTQSFSMGLFVARVQRGSHIILEQTCVGDAVWVPKRLEVRASARILFLKSLNMDRILTYSDYRPATDGPYSVSR